MKTLARPALQAQHTLKPTPQSPMKHNPRLELEMLQADPTYVANLGRKAEGLK